MREFSGQVLVLDDEAGNLATIRFNFGRKYNLIESTDPIKALELLKDQPCQIMLVDQRMPGMDGLEFVRKAKEICPDSLAIILTAYADITVVVDALNSGLVYRYLHKPWDRTELEATLRQAGQHLQLAQENRALLTRLDELSRHLGKEVEERAMMDILVGESREFRNVMELVQQVSPTSSSVLITGESGTGKELIAREIHRRSSRSGGPFIRVNCGALAPGLVESELFGHEKGSFTGAYQKKTGRFELAHQGSIFLDEVGDLAPELQVKLLRVIQEREFERVGGTQTISVDVRIICATHRDLHDLVKKGGFREDLFWRIAVFPIHMPPLRTRKEDILPLAEYFRAKLVPDTGRNVLGFSPEAQDILSSCSWPGNVRELENAIERAMIVTRGELIDAQSLDFLVLPHNKASLSPPDLGSKMERIEYEEVKKALEDCSWSVSAAARALGLKRTALYYKMKKYGLEQ